METVKLQAPEGATVVTYQEEDYKVSADGTVDIPIEGDDLAQLLTPVHGFTIVSGDQEAKPQRKGGK